MAHDNSARLTELEGTVLGFIGLKGTCTPYAVRREFLASPSPHWSGSAGAIYPLVTRLEKRGLIRVADRTADGRSGKLYCLTASGRRALRKWIGAPVSLDVAGVPPDPLRNRIEHFPLLTKEEQRAFLEDAQACCREHLDQLKEYMARKRDSGEFFAHLVVRGSVRMMQVRLDWLHEVTKALGLSAPTSRKKHHA